MTEQWRTNNINTHHPTRDLIVRLRHGPTDYCPILQVPVVDECSFDLPEEEMRPSKLFQPHSCSPISTVFQWCFQIALLTQGFMLELILYATFLEAEWFCS